MTDEHVLSRQTRVSAVSAATEGTTDATVLTDRPHGQRPSSRPGAGRLNSRATRTPAQIAHRRKGAGRRGDGGSSAVLQSGGASTA